MGIINYNPRSEYYLISFYDNIVLLLEINKRRWENERSSILDEFIILLD
jgi:hypothetical protein